MGRKPRFTLCGVTVNETEARLLALMARLATDGEPPADEEDAEPLCRVVTVGKRAIAKEMGCSEVSVRRATLGLERAGLLQVIPRRLENGGQLENAYQVTREGVLALAEFTARQIVR